jgi:hypothetical protein
MRGVRTVMNSFICFCSMRAPSSRCSVGLRLMGRQMSAVLNFRFISEVHAYLSIAIERD